MDDQDEYEMDDVPGLGVHFKDGEIRVALPAHTTAYPGPSAEQKVKQGEILMTCPYNLGHMTTSKKCLMHYTNCRKAYLAALPNPADCKIHICKYDSTHHVAEDEYGQHLLECARRNFRDELRSRPYEGIRVPHLGQHRMVRAIPDHSDVLTGLTTTNRGAAVKHSSSSKPNGKGLQGLAELCKASKIWEDETLSEDTTEEETIHSGSVPEQFSSTEVEVWKPAQCQTPEASPPKDVLAMEKIDRHADFEKDYPLMRSYNVSPPTSGWTTEVEDEHDVSSSEVDRSEILPEEEADFGQKKHKNRHMCLSSDTETTDTDITAFETGMETDTSSELD